MRVEISFKDCVACPFKQFIYDKGLCGNFCQRGELLVEVPSTGVRKDCPLMKNIDFHYRVPNGGEVIYSVKEGAE